MHPARATTRQDDGELKARTRALLSPRKALTILRRREKCLHHFSVYEVAIELVELRQPEVITLEVVRGLGRIVRIAAQISEVLHQHKCPIEFAARCLIIKSTRTLIRCLTNKSTRKEVTAERRSVPRSSGGWQVKVLVFSLLHLVYG